MSDQTEKVAMSAPRPALAALREQIEALRQEEPYDRYASAAANVESLRMVYAYNGALNAVLALLDAQAEADTGK